MNDSSSNDGSVETLASSAATIDRDSRNTTPNRSSATGSDSTRRNPIVDFARACDSTYHPSRPQEVAAGLVHDALAAGEARFIMNMPPRHGKSRLVAVEKGAHVHFKPSEARNPGIPSLRWPGFENRSPALDAFHPVDEEGRPLHVVRKNKAAFRQAQWELALLNLRVLDLRSVRTGA